MALLDLTAMSPDRAADIERFSGSVSIRGKARWNNPRPIEIDATRARPDRHHCFDIGLHRAVRTILPDKSVALRFQFRRARRKEVRH